MNWDMAALIFIGLAIVGGALIYFAISVDRTASEVNAIRTSPLGSVLLGIGS